VKALQQQCEDLPLGDAGCCIFRTGAMEVVACVWSTLEACKGEAAENATKAGECAINRVDGEIMSQIWQLYDRPIGPADYQSVNKQIALYPAMIAEIRKQEDDLAFVESHTRIGRDERAKLLGEVTERTGTFSQGNKGNKGDRN